MKIIRSAILAAVLAVAGGAATAADWKPTGPVTLVVHAGPGGGNDVFGRAMLQIMDKEKLLPVRFTLINKVGGGSAIAMNYLKEKAGDDLTIGLYTSTFFINPLVAEDATTTMETLTPIANLLYEPALVVVRADSPFKTLLEFIEAAKANPNKYKQSAGNILAREAVVRQLIMQKTGAAWSYISFPSAGERMSALLGGHTDIMMIEPSEESGLIKSGKMRALAQIATKRLDAFPDVPTLKEAGVDIIDVPQVRGVLGAAEHIERGDRLLSGPVRETDEDRRLESLHEGNSARTRLHAGERIEDLHQDLYRPEPRIAQDSRRQGRSLTRCPPGSPPGGLFFVR